MNQPGFTNPVPIRIAPPLIRGCSARYSHSIVHGYRQGYNWGTSNLLPKCLEHRGGRTPCLKHGAGLRCPGAPRRQQLPVVGHQELPNPRLAPRAHVGRSSWADFLWGGRSSLADFLGRKTSTPGFLFFLLTAGGSP